MARRHVTIVLSAIEIKALTITLNLTISPTKILKFDEMIFLFDQVDENSSKFRKTQNSPSGNPAPGREILFPESLCLPGKCFLEISDKR